MAIQQLISPQRLAMHLMVLSEPLTFPGTPLGVEMGTDETMGIYTDKIIYQKIKLTAPKDLD